MAAGGEEQSCLLAGSEEVVDSPCSLCLADNQTVRSTCRCIECASNLCPRCLDMHKRFPANSGHHVVDIGQAQGQRMNDIGAILTESRPTRQDEFLRTLFQAFDLYGSRSSSNTTDGGVQTGVRSPPAPVRSRITVKTLKDAKSKVINVKEQLQMVKTMKQDQRNNIVALEQSHIHSIDNLQAKFISQIKDLTDAEYVKIRTKFLPSKDKITAEIADIDEQIKVAENDDRALANYINATEDVQCINMIEIEKNVQDGTRIHERLWQTLDMTNPQYLLDPNVEKVLQNIPSLGEFAITAELQGEIEARSSGDTSVSDINGSCLLADGSLVLVDADNKKLKHINLENQQMNYCEFTAEPCAVCSSGFAEVAVTLPKEKKVQFVSLMGSPIKKGCFTVGGHCRGIYHHDGQLIVSCGDIDDIGSAFIGVYNMSGNCLRKIEKHEDGRRIFAAPFHLAVDNGGHLHVADAVYGVITIDKYGKFSSVYNDGFLERAFGLCTLDNNSILVSGLDSHNVIQLRTQNMTKVTTLLDKSSGIYCPQSLLYDFSKSLLIVTFQQSDSVKLYKLSY